MEVFKDGKNISDDDLQNCEDYLDVISVIKSNLDDRVVEEVRLNEETVDSCCPDKNPPVEDIDKLEIETQISQDPIEVTLEELQGYLPRVISIYEKALNELKNGRQEETINLIQSGESGLDWCLRVIDKTFPMIEDENLEYESKSLEYSLWDNIGVVKEKGENISGERLENILEEEIIPRLYRLEKIARQIAGKYETDWLI